MVESESRAKNNYQKNMCDFVDEPESNCSTAAEDWESGLKDAFSG